MNNLRRKNKIVAIIPFYNEKDFLKSVVSETLKYVDLIIAVDDGSTDDSAVTIKDFENVLILKNEKNFGKGYSLQKGFDTAINLNFDIIVTIDGDGQHNPEFIPKLLEELNYSDAVIGNRLNDIRSMPFHRILSNKITSFLLSKKLGIKICDSQSGFRAFKKKVIEGVKTEFYGFEAESEIIVKIARKNFKINFIDIPTIYGNQKTKMKSVQAIKGFLKVLKM